MNYKKKPLPQTSKVSCTSCGRKLKDFELFFREDLCAACLNALLLKQKRQKEEAIKAGLWYE